MYEKNDKRHLLWLMDEYLAGQINESVFCDEYYSSFDLEINKDNLTQNELKAYNELNLIVSRFSPFEQDHQLDPRAFSSKDELREEIIKTRNIISPKKL